MEYSCILSAFPGIYFLISDTAKWQSRGTPEQGRGKMTENASFTKLKEYHDKHGAQIKMQDMFKTDSGRFNKYR